MANVVDVKTLFNGRRTKVFHLVGMLDTAQESDVAKIDISAFTDPLGRVATYTAIDKIEFAVNNGYVLLEWDHTTDDEIATLTGQGCIDWTPMGGNVDPRTAGATGDIVLTTLSTGTIGATNALTYDITIYVRMKA
jgi:hypothetical protein